MTQHLTKDGEPKLVKKCSLPLTGAKVVSRVYSDYAILDITEKGFKVIELNEKISLEHLQIVTDGLVYQ
jgi:3-oxoacid CoA-transferase subunit B